MYPNFIYFYYIGIYKKKLFSRYLTNVSFMSAGENELSTVPQEIGESNI
jgi:hypothetical protein